MTSTMYRDYTKLKKHRVRLWKLSDGIPLTQMGGLDLPALGTAVGAALAAAAVVGVVLFLVGINPALWAALVGAIVLLVSYMWMTSEKVKQTPLGILRSFIIERWQPLRYAMGVGADWEATELRWQVIFWRPSWSRVRIGGLRRWTTYEPAPVSSTNRRMLDSTGVDEQLGWYTPHYERNFG